MSVSLPSWIKGDVGKRLAAPKEGPTAMQAAAIRKRTEVILGGG